MKNFKSLCFAFVNWVGHFHLELGHIRGQVWKWCLDRFGNYSAEPVINPRGATTGNVYLLRGGSYFSGENDARLACRNRGDPGLRYIGIGFRLVLAPE